MTCWARPSSETKILVNNLRPEAFRPHPCRVRNLGLCSFLRPKRRGISHKLISWTLSRSSIRGVGLLTAALALSTLGSGVDAQQVSKKTPPPLGGLELAGQPPRLRYEGVPAPLPQDQGTVGLRQMMTRLQTTASLMQVVAHPDDEDGGMLTLESRGHGDSVLLMTLNRGEGGQNKIGSNLSDVLGVLRAEELLASDQYYGVQERFSRVADFGFSKSAEETFQKWGGHDIALGDMVRVVRTFRPDVLIARFSGTSRDGHGNHQASGILTREAFRAAADPRRFPEQITEGLAPWQAKKLYIGNVCGFGASTCPDDNWTIKLNTGQRSDLLGMSYVQFAMQGLRHQLSQGAGSWTLDPGDHFTYYKLADTVLPSAEPALKPGVHEKDFFDGIDTSLPGLASRLGGDESKLPHVRQQLTDISSMIAAAVSKANGNDPSSAAEPLSGVVPTFVRINEEVEQSSMEPSSKQDLLARLKEKLYQAEKALNLALNVSLTAEVSATPSNPAQVPKEDAALATLSPRDEFFVTVKMHNGSQHPLAIENVQLQVPSGWSSTSDEHRHVTVKAGDDLRVVFKLQVPKDAAYTNPYWHRDDPDRESINQIDNEKYATLPFPPPPLRAAVEYKFGKISNLILSPVTAEFLDDAGKTLSHPIAIVPRFSVMLEPGTQVMSTHNGRSSRVTVGVTCNCAAPERGVLRLEVPEGWHAEPSQFATEFSARGEKKDFHFQVFSGGLQQGRTALRAVLQTGNENYDQGYTLVTRDDLGSFYYFQPARQRVSIVDVTVPHELKIGYIMGAGDTIPTVLEQLGMNVTMIPAEKLATEDLTQYGTIVLGIRTYDTQKDAVENNKKLLDYVHNGGTLLVQYNASTSDFNAEHLTPYPADLSHARVSVEEAPVDILEPGNPIFHFPNTITQHDFDGWIQERGLYFMDKWDDHFKPLLACHDPGEAPQKGGLLLAHYGKGTYIYTGYSFFRELPAGVPGAVRLYVNLLSAGHEGLQ